MRFFKENKSFAYYLVFLYFAGLFSFLLSFLLYRLNENIFIFLVWTALFVFLEYFSFEIRLFPKLQITFGLGPALMLASYVLFGLPFAFLLNTAGTLIYYIRKKLPVSSAFATISVLTVSYFLANLISPVKNGPFFLLFKRLFFFWFSLEIFTIFLNDFYLSLKKNISLKKLLLSEFKEFLPVETISTGFVAPIALIVVYLYPAYFWALPFLFILFYGLKLFGENAQKIQEEMEKAVNAMTRIVEAKDDLTERHIDRVSRYAEVIARHYGLSDSEIEKVTKVARIHDIGKILVEDEVLQKPGKLTEEEFDHIKIHVRYDFIGSLLPSPFPIFERMTLARFHHERWDGKGYPFGVKETEIPLPARIVSVADAWDAMTSTRVYRQGLSEEKALQILKENAGIQWDPVVVEAFFKAYENGEIQGISAEYKAMLYGSLTTGLLKP